ncbi:GNAT family N-acetyltransferase [Streptomyces actinomycinicus]|uniref:GNAT family N-acetyltransferase n=1 Tax=Streptomyces actinomycinicus TaxID=1695166 RepID=A0A937EQP4_9ACTN|nr:GNAT family protein [Streptomyces actinomycinicus]MBL1086640.1 GNAT family N-acetyltransferase [Streptomyces actinomycinicus]
MYATSLGDGAELKPLEVWHAAELLANIDRGREFIGRHVGLPDVVSDLAGAHAWLKSYADKRSADAGSVHGIWLDGTLVGGLLFRVWDTPGGVCEAGCWLEPAAAGRGLVTRGMRVLLDWAFEERGMHRVEWYVSAANEPSIAVARRLGMTREGLFRENYLHRGVRTSTEIWAVLAPEWRAARAGTAHGDH